MWLLLYIKVYLKVNQTYKSISAWPVDATVLRGLSVDAIFTMFTEADVKARPDRSAERKMYG
jgi:hypothetical protein